MYARNFFPEAFNPSPLQPSGAKRAHNWILARPRLLGRLTLVTNDVPSARCNSLSDQVQIVGVKRKRAQPINGLEEGGPSVVQRSSTVARTKTDREADLWQERGT
jgi:hypothetical protein